MRRTGWPPSALVAGCTAAFLQILGWLAPLVGLRLPLLHVESVRPLLWIASIAALQITLWKVWPRLEGIR